jgi:hypothetical protein
MFLLEWMESSEVVSDWSEVVNHPFFPVSTVYERLTGFGWVAV